MTTMELFQKSGKVKKRIGDILLALGILPHLDGYEYLMVGINYCVEQPGLARKLTKGLYPLIGKCFGKTISQVERGIRHAIDSGWSRDKFSKLNEIFRVQAVDKRVKPKSGELIALLADRLLFELAEQAERDSQNKE